MKIALVIAMLTGAAAAQTSSTQPVVFEHTWENGYYSLGGRLEKVPDGFFSGWSQNFEGNVDGTGSKTFGSTLDSALVGADTTVNLLSTLTTGRYPYPRNWGVAVIGNEFFKRDNSAGTWSSLTVPTSLRTTGADKLQATQFDGNLIIGGDISALARFDGGTAVYRSVPVIPQDSTKGTVDPFTVQSVAWSDTTTPRIYYATWVNNAGDETYSLDTLQCPSNTSTEACSLNWTQPYPPMFSGDIDSSQWVSRRIYVKRLGDAGVIYLTDLPVTQTAWTDSGQAENSLGKRTPPRYSQIIHGRFPAVFNDQLWIDAGYDKVNNSRRSQFVLNDAIVDSITTYATVLPDYNSKYEIGKVTLDEGTHGAISGITWMVAATWTGLADSTYKCNAPGANFVSNGVVPGDYIICYATSMTPTLQDEKPIYRVVAVLNDSQIVADGHPQGIMSVGKNLARIGNEVVGFAWADQTNLGRWYVGNYNDGVAYPTVGLFGTTASGHAAGTPIYSVDTDFIGYAPQDPFFRSEVFNPTRFQTNDPYWFDVEDVTGTFTGPGYLGVTSRDQAFAITGTDPFYVSPITQGIGSAATPFGYAGGAFVLDDRGPYYITDTDQQFLGTALGSAMRDSAQTGYYDDAAIHMGAQKLYVSIPKNSALDCITYVADMTRQTPLGEPPWARVVGLAPRTFATWTDANADRATYFGSWAEGAVIKLDDTVGYNQDSAGNQDSIQVVVVTGADRVVGWRTQFQKVQLTIDTNDSVTVTGFFVDRGQTSSRVIGTIAKSDSSEGAGVFRDYKWNVGRTAEAAYWEIKQYGTNSRFTLGPVRVIGEVSEPR